MEGYWPTGSWDVSDHSYSLLEGDDYFPDVFVGRLSVRTQLELNTIMSKIINYESNPLIADNWQNKALMMAYVDEYMQYFSALRGAYTLGNIYSGAAAGQIGATGTAIAVGTGAGTGAVTGAGTGAATGIGWGAAAGYGAIGSLLYLLRDGSSKECAPPQG